MKCGKYLNWGYFDVYMYKNTYLKHIASNVLLVFTAMYTFDTGYEVYL